MPVFCVIQVAVDSEKGRMHKLLINLKNKGTMVCYQKLAYANLKIKIRTNLRCASCDAECLGHSKFAEDYT
jgi:hypothetical protein